MENQISMNSIKALKDFVTKQSDEFKSEPDPYSAPDQPDSALDVPDITDINTGEPEDFDDGGKLVPATDRLYLVQGKIPNTEHTPSELNIRSYHGINDKTAMFVDKKDLHLVSRNTYDEAHPAEHSSYSYGGIVMNEKGEVLMRSPSDKNFGNEWTFAKGAAEHGENDREAALREVLEETGMQCRIASEIPGHYNANAKNTKYFLMEVEDEDKWSGKLDETSEVKWMSPDKAEKALTDPHEDKDWTKDEEAAERDLHALRAGVREHTNHNRRSATANKVGERARKQKLAANEVLNALYDEFGETGEMPDLTNAEFAPLLRDLGHEIMNPKAYTTDSYQVLQEAMGNFMKKADERRGYNSNQEASFSDLLSTLQDAWGGHALKTSPVTNIVNAAVCEEFGLPETYMFGNPVPADISLSGRGIFRTDELRQEMIDTYDKWKSEGGDGRGTFSNGEKYNFGTDTKMTVRHKTTKSGNDLVEKQYPAWEAVIAQAKTTQEVKNDLNGYSWIGNTGGLYRKLGNALLESKGYIDPPEISTVTNEELILAGREFTKDFVRETYKINQAFLKAVFPETDHIYVTRVIGDAREIDGDSALSIPHKPLVEQYEERFPDDQYPTGKEASRKYKYLAAINEENLEKLGFPTIHDEDPNGEGWKADAYSAGLAGYSADPEIHVGSNEQYKINRRVNLRDIWMSQSLWNPGHDSERELLVMNNPDSPARIVHKDGPIWNSDNWERHHNGYTTTNMHGSRVRGKHDKYNGIASPDKDFKTELAPATEDDDPIMKTPQIHGMPKGQLGTNTGGLHKDSDGKLYYVKHSEPERNATEDLANTLYKIVGVPVPDTEVVRWGGGDGTSLKSTWMEGAKYHAPDGGLTGTPNSALTDHDDIKHGFLMDAVLCNWDVVGAGSEKPYGNIVEHNGRMVRLDQGGSMEFSGLQGKKLGTGSPFWDGHQNPQWNDDLDEISTLRDPSMNHTTANLFKSMTDDDLHEAGKKLLELKDSRIEDAVNNSAIPATNKDRMIDTLKDRRDAALTWWVKNTDSGYNSFEDLQSKTYIQKQDLLKADNSDLKKHKNVTRLFFDNCEGARSNGRQPPTSEYIRDLMGKYESMKKLHDANWQHLKGEN